MSDTRGRFCWFDLNALDIDGAIDFYTKVVPWGTQLFEGAAEGAPEYKMWTAGGNPIGGVMVLPEQAKAMGAPPHWLGYVSVPDCDAAIARAGELGGKALVPGTDIPNVGRFAVLQDPQGAVFALFQAADTVPGNAGDDGLGEIGWAELATTDWKAAWEFYSAMFGWNVTEDMDMGPEMGGNYRMFGRLERSDKSMGGMFNAPPEMPMSAWLFYVEVEDVDATVEAVKAHGGKVVNGPMDVPGGSKIAQCVDPQGAMFAIHAP